MVTNITGVIGIAKKEPVLQDKTVVLSGSEQEITADSGYDGLGTVTIPAAPVDNLPAVMFGTETAPTIASPDSNHKNFVGINSLTEITLSDATSIANNAFKNLTELETVSATAVLSVGQNSFYNCQGLTSLSLPNCTSIGNEAFNNAFKDSANVSLTLPEVLSIGNQAFYNAKLKTLSCPKAITIGSEILQDSEVTSISLPAVTSLPNGALQWAHNLTSVYLPECLSLGNSSLLGCGFSSINLPKVTTMGREQFASNEHIRDVYLGYNGVVTVNKGDDRDYRMFDEWQLQGQTITIHVPAGQLSAYESDSVWTAIVAEEAQESRTIVFAGDYA